MPSSCPFIFTLTTFSLRTFTHSSSSQIYFHRHPTYAILSLSISVCSSLSLPPPRMADSQGHKHGGVGSRKQLPSRLQMRAPSSLRVNRSCDWNVAIPLLSPLASSPPPVKLGVQATEREEARQMQQRQQGVLRVALLCGASFLPLRVNIS